MKKYKLLVFIIAVLFVFSVFPFNNVYAVEGTETLGAQKTEELTSRWECHYDCEN